MLLFLSIRCFLLYLSVSRSLSFSLPFSLSLSLSPFLSISFFRSLSVFPSLSQFSFSVCFSYPFYLPLIIFILPFWVNVMISLIFFLYSRHLSSSSIRGAFSQVWRALNNSSKEHVAVKVINKKCLSERVEPAWREPEILRWYISLSVNSNVEVCIELSVTHHSPLTTHHIGLESLIHMQCTHTCWYSPSFPAWNMTTWCNC